MNYWIIDVDGASHTLPEDVVKLMKSAPINEHRAEQLLDQLKCTLTNLKRNPTEKKMVPVLMSRIGMLVKRLCKDIVQAKTEDQLLSDVHVANATRLLEESNITYKFRQTVA
jgi:hypothetical protein